MEIALQRMIAMRKEVAVTIQGIKLIGLLAYTPVYSSLILWGIGMFILLPFASFTTPVYAVFLSIAPEWLWGLIFTLIGGASMITIFTLGIRHTLSYYACMTVAGIWLVFAVEFFLSVPESIGVPLFGLLTLGGMTILIPETMLARKGD